VRLSIRDREVANRQLALANATLGIPSSAVGLKRSFRQSATRQRRKPRTNAARVAGPGRIFVLAFLSSLDLRILFSYTWIAYEGGEFNQPTFFQLA
jgi:hypothetical protein